METFDCIIAGAGPAGLGCALCCSQYGMKVLVIERGQVGDTNHSWIIWLDFLKQYDLLPAIRSEIDALTFRSFLGSEYALRKTISASVHENVVLALLCEKARKAGSIFHEKESCVSYRYIQDRIIIKTETAEYSGAFFIDAMGESSPILTGCGVDMTHAMGMGCYGYDIEGLSIANPHETIIFDAYFPGRDYFWFIPYDAESAFVGVFFFQEFGTLSFHHAVQSLHKYIKIKKLKGTIQKTRKGIIPLTAKPFIQKDTILFIGDTASSALPSSGFGFVRSFEEGIEAARFIKQYFDKHIPLKQYETMIYKLRYPGYEMHYLISNMVVNLNDQLLHKAIQNMNHIPLEYIVHFLKGDDMSLRFVMQSLFHIHSTFTLSEIRDMAIKQNYKNLMLRLYAVYPRITIPVLKREFQTLLAEIKEKLPKDFLKK